MPESNPWDNPNWMPLHRESQLVRQLLGSGITSIGKANYADKMGEYYTAFFALSIGIERLTKLILITDFAIKNGGTLPEQSIIRRFGHELGTLIDATDQISKSRGLKLGFPRPAGQICSEIVNCLDAFADAKRGRYANFQSLGNPNFSNEFEPIKRWWANVAELILTRHYRDSKLENRVNSNADLLDDLLSRFTSVLHFNEAGKTMDNVRAASVRTGETQIVQKYGRFYVASIIRWLSDTFHHLSSKACYEQGIDAFFGHSEFFNTYRVEDSFLMSRKNWPLK